MRFCSLLLLALALLTGCAQPDATPLLPTPITPEARATEIVLTQNAPPPGFDTVRFPAIDDHLRLLPGWRYEATLIFEGVFSDTPRPTRAEMHAEVWFNQVASARRVVAQTSGDLFGQPEPLETEAVRLGPDAFLVQDGVCLSNAGEDAAVAADLSAGSLLGGVRVARAQGQQATINDEKVWRYAFLPSDLILPTVDLSASNAALDGLNGELWVSPEHNAVVRFYLNFEVRNARLLGGDLPVTGTVLMRYDLYDVGVVPNLSVPFGC